MFLQVFNVDRHVYAKTRVDGAVPQNMTRKVASQINKVVEKINGNERKRRIATRIEMIDT